MTQVRIDGVGQQPVIDAKPHWLTPERLRTVVESAHLNFLIGAGTSSPYFAPLVNIEDALAELADSNAPHGPVVDWSSCSGRAQSSRPTWSSTAMGPRLRPR